MAKAALLPARLQAVNASPVPMTKSRDGSLSAPRRAVIHSDTRSSGMNGTSMYSNLTRSIALRVPGARLLILPCLLSLAAVAGAAGLHADHAGDTHGSSGAGAGTAVTAPDERGRQLYAAPHAMDPARFEELRQRLPPMAAMDDAAIMQMMHAMGPNYTWHVSPPSVQGNPGVLVLGHGFRDYGDQMLHTRLQPVAGRQPLSLALGMSMLTSAHIQLALDNLAAVGAGDVLVIPAVSSEHNTMLRQWRYIFGLQPEAEYARVPQVQTSLRVHFLPPLNDHPLVAEMLVDRADEISRAPAEESLFIVAHGPVSEADNLAQLATLQRLAAAVRELRPFAAVDVVTLQDDAEPAVRRANVQALRDRVAAEQAQGRDVLVITNLLSNRIVQSQLRRDLRGLNYRFNPRGLVEHDTFIRWIEASVAAASAELTANRVSVRLPDDTGHVFTESVQ